MYQKLLFQNVLRSTQTVCCCKYGQINILLYVGTELKYFVVKLFYTWKCFKHNYKINTFVINVWNKQEFVRTEVWQFYVFGLGFGIISIAVNVSLSILCGTAVLIENDYSVSLQT